MRKRLIGYGLIIGVLTGCTGGQRASAAPTGESNQATVNVSLTMRSFAQVIVNTNGLSSIALTLPQYQAGERDGDTVGLIVYTNDSAGCKVTIKADPGDN